MVFDGMMSRANLLKQLDRLPRNAKRGIAVALDLSGAAVSVAVALYLRLGVWVAISGELWWALVGALFAVPVLAWFGMYRTIYRYVGRHSYRQAVRAAACFGLAYAAVFTLVGISGIPRTLGIIVPLVMFLVVFGSRWAFAQLFGPQLRRAGDRFALVYGAGEAARHIGMALHASREMRLMGFVDDDPNLHNSTLDGTPIYPSRALGEVIAEHGITDVLLVLPDSNHKERMAIVDRLTPLGVKVRILPHVMDLATGKLDISLLRPIEIEDILVRDEAVPDPSLFGPIIEGKTVMVTGAGGSIGSELCRQIISARPQRLLLVEISEYALYEITRDLERQIAASGQPVELVPLLASVRDEARMRQLMQCWRPESVFHAAAYKHVPIVEENVCQGILNNAFGTQVVAELAIESGASHFVLVSTDKAVRPTNVMGASKRLAELMLLRLHQRGARTRLSMVRFGNVLGSSGSVVPLFRQQIAKGGPVTITHQDVTRYFMTIPEAAQLVLQAGAMASGGEVFVLDTGEPVKIIDLARRMVELSGLKVRDAANPDGDVEIKVTGLRPGEKLYEELLIGDNPTPTAHPRIMKAHEDYLAWPDLEAQLHALQQAARADDVQGIKAVLSRCVHGYGEDAQLIG